MALSIVINVECNKFDEFKRNLFSIKNFDILNGFNEIIFGNWTQDQKCLAELHAIKNGLKNSEEWAYKSECEFVSFKIIFLLLK